MAQSKKVKGLSVTPKREGFCRGGRCWNGTTKVTLDEFTEEQINQIKNEPMLVVVECDIEVAEEKATK